MGSNRYEPISNTNRDFTAASDALREGRNSLLRAEMQRVADEEQFLRDQKYRNYNIDADQMILSEHFIDENTLTENQRRLSQYSMLSLAEIASLDDKEAAEQARKSNILYSFLLFILATISMSLSGPIDEFAYRDPETGLRSVTCHPSIPMLLSYVISVSTCSIISGLAYGASGLFTMWNPKLILEYFPIAFAFCIQENISTIITATVGSTFMRVLGQSKLILTAFFGKILLNRDLTGSQWMILASTSLSIVSSMIGQLAETQAIDIWRTLTAFLSITLVTLTGLWSELSFKRDSSPFIIQYGRSRIAGWIGSVILLLFTVIKDDRWEILPMAGWQTRYWIASVNNAIMCFVVTSVIKRLDSLWKTLAAALALCGNYAVCIIFKTGSTDFHLPHCLLILTIATDIIAFACAKRDETKILQLTADIEHAIKV